jgi:hypothetical protein
VARKPKQPPTQALRPSHFVDVDVFYTPTKRRVASEGRLLSKDITVAEARSLLDADADRLEPKDDGRKRLPVQIYVDDARRMAYRRVSRSARVAPQGVKDNRRERAATSEKEKQRWNKMAKPLWPEYDRKRDVADIIAERTGARFDTVYRALKRPQ